MAKAAQRSGAQRTGAQRTGAQRTGTQRTGTQRTGTQRTETKGTGTQRNGTGTKGAQRNGAQAQRNGTQQARPRRDVAPPPAAPEPVGPPSWLRWATFALAILGLGVSAYLTYTHFSDSALAGCTETSGAINCGKVTTSPQSVVFGIPVAVLGLAFYVFLVAIMSPWAWRSGRREVALTRLVSLVVGVGFVLYLLYAELFQVGAICLYCTSVHIITFLLFVLTGLAVAIWGLTPASRARR
jgi:uncharacterized membrane protein